MSFSRYFILTDPGLIQHLENWKAACKAVQAKRDAFLDEWGSHMILTGGSGGLSVCGLADPRKMDPPRPLPKGWRRWAKYPDYVEATSSETRGILHVLRYPQPEKIDNEILTMIAMIDPLNQKRIFGDDKPEHRAKRTWWDGPAPEGRMVVFNMGFQRFSEKSLLPEGIEVPGDDGFWAVMIPDEGLRFNSLPGMEEIFAWKFQEMCGNNPQ